MIKLTKQQEKAMLVAVFAVLALLIVYRATTMEKPKTAPLIYPRGSVARSAVRQAAVESPSGADPLGIFIAKRKERYPGVSRDIFRMENPAPKPKPAPVVAAPAPLPPPPPQQTPEEIAADLSRADLAKFRFLGYLTDKDNNTLFLSKDGELLIVKSGDTFGKSYQVTRATKDYVVLLDTNTRVEMRFDLAGSGGEAQPATPQQPRSPVPAPLQMPPQAPRPALQPAHQPAPPPHAAPQRPSPQISEEPQQSPDEPVMPDRPMRRRLRPAIPPTGKP